LLLKKRAEMQSQVARAGEATPLLKVEDLHVYFLTSRGIVRAVEGLSFDVKKGEIVAIVGESGSGKSVSALSIMRLLPRMTGRIPKGRITFDGKRLLELGDEEMREIRGRDISMIFQEPMTSLNPILTIGLQIAEPLQIHMGMNEAQARERAVELMGLVGIPDPERRLDQYPHQFSGGMRQRVMIAIGLACNPKLIIADEPTTALDVTIQAQILDLIRDLQSRLGLAVILVTHDLGIVAEYADDVTILYSARVMEQASVKELFSNPLHPYTCGLLESMPGVDHQHRHRLQAIPGNIPSALNPPKGCRFHPRGPRAIDDCVRVDPALERKAPGHDAACIRV
jgi:peptide/nickel transport system ATP-binding protein